MACAINTVAMMATGTMAYVSFFSALGVAWDDSMVARWSANSLGMLWPEMDAAFVGSGGGGGPPAVARRPVVIISAS